MRGLLNLNIMSLEIKNDVPTRRSSIILEKARLIAEDHEATVEEIARYMRKLYFYDTIDDESIKVYLKLEYKWKLLTNFKASTGPVFRFNQTTKS
jgi:hypothetical protein